MFKNIKKANELIIQVLTKRKYFLVFLIVTILSFAVMYKLTFLNIANESLGTFVMMWGNSFTFISLVGAGIISLLFGVFSSLFAYKIAVISQFSGKTGFFSMFGLSAGLFSAGCPTCGAALFALFGAPLALMFFPLKGLELKILSIGLLVISNHFLAKSFLGCDITKK